MLAAGCAAERPFVWVNAQHLPKSDPHSAYVIDAGDAVTVRVYNDAALSTTATVRTDGVISLLLVGEIEARGKRPTELARDVEAALTKYMTSPSVMVTVDSVHTLNVIVAGAVATPGVQQVRPGTRLVEVLALAGGLTEFADDTRIFLVRRGAAEGIRFTQKMLHQGNSVAASVQVNEGDLVIVE